MQSIESVRQRFPAVKITGEDEGRFLVFDTSRPIAWLCTTAEQAHLARLGANNSKTLDLEPAASYVPENITEIGYE